MASSTKRSKIIFPPGEKIANNDDLLLQILVRLPVKPLLKFKSVSKHWLSLITNPNFSRRGYLPHSPPCICGLFLDIWSRSTNQLDFINLDCKHSNSPFQTLTSIDYPQETRILQSCNGLLLCSSIPSFRSPMKYYVCNPTTKQRSKLPPLTPDSEFSGPFLAFDPSKSPDFKVICIRQFEIEEPEFQIEVYSSKSGKWRLTEARFSLDLDIGIHGGVFWNGGIHWYTDSGPCFYFDVDGEEIKEMAMPIPIPDDWYRRRVTYFGESGGHLQLIEIYHPPSTQFDVWEMKNDRSGWLMKYRVNLDGIVSEFPGMIRSFLDPSELNYYVFEILCIVEGEREEEDESYMVLHIPANIIRYDLKTGSCKKLCDFPPVAGSSDRENASTFYYYGAHQYIESLVPVPQRSNGSGASKSSVRIPIHERTGQFWIHRKQQRSNCRRNGMRNLKY